MNDTQKMLASMLDKVKGDYHPGGQRRTTQEVANYEDGSYRIGNGNRLGRVYLVPEDKDGDEILSFRVENVDQPRVLEAAKRLFAGITKILQTRPELAGQFSQMRFRLAGTRLKVRLGPNVHYHADDRYSMIFNIVPEVPGKDELLPRVEDLVIDIDDVEGIDMGEIGSSFTIEDPNLMRELNKACEIGRRRGVRNTGLSLDNILQV